MKFLVLLTIVHAVASLNRDEIALSTEYFKFKQVKYVCYFSCDNDYNNKRVSLEFMRSYTRFSMLRTSQVVDNDLVTFLKQWNVPVGVLLDGLCTNTQHVLSLASKSKLFDAMHHWLILHRVENDTAMFIEDHFQNINLSIDADVAVASCNGKNSRLTDVYNFGRIQGNGLEQTSLGSYSRDGLNITLRGYKYYNRWDFHNLTLRAISVILDQPSEFYPEQLSDEGYAVGVAAMTKITSQLLNILKEKHNFRFNYTIASRWIGEPELNSTLAVTNSLYWEEQDLSSTCARIFPAWLKWVDIFHPPTTNLQTKFYYLIPNKGVGNYENRFLTPMSLGVWWCTLAACVICSLVLTIGAWLEARPKPAVYAFFSVSAAICQQDYDEGMQEEKFSSQGRKLTLLVVGLTSMLLYNYYTSSVVSWLLSAATPSIDTLEKLINSEFELVFEDIGYTRGWLDNPGFYYFSGVKNVKEDDLREIKVAKAKRTEPVLQNVDAGFELVRKGGYAFHTEPYTASQVIGRTFLEEELCELGSLQMMLPARVYVMSQKRSPYKEFFNWSLMRLSERGHFQASRGRFPGTIPGCSGRRPRALELGHAAPVFIMLLQFTVLSIFIMIAERIHYRFQTQEKAKADFQQKTSWARIQWYNHAHNAQESRDRRAQLHK